MHCISKMQWLSSPSYIHMEVTGTNTVGGGGGIAFDTSASNALSNNTLYLATITGIRNSADNGSNDLVFSTTQSNVNSNLPVEKLRITSAGNIGIGNDGSIGLYTGENDRNLILGTGAAILAFNYILELDLGVVFTLVIAQAPLPDIVEQ